MNHKNTQAFLSGIEKRIKNGKIEEKRYRSDLKNIGFLMKEKKITEWKYIDLIVRLSEAACNGIFIEPTE